MAARAVLGTLVAASLSCSAPLGEDPKAGEDSAPNAVTSLSAVLTWFRQDSAGPGRYRIHVVATNRDGAAAAGAPLTWLAASAQDSVIGPSRVGPDGRADLDWLPGGTPAAVHHLEIRSGLHATVRIVALGDSTSPQGATMDTVGAVVPGGIDVQVLNPSGRPVGGVALQVTSSSGGDATGSKVLLTDDNGRAVSPWHLGTEAGPQSVVIRFLPGVGGLRLRAVRTGELAAPGAPLTLKAMALPGTPHRVNLPATILEADAIGARLPLIATAEDRFGNVLLQPRLVLQSADTGVVRVASDGGILTAGPGMTRVRVSVGLVRDSVMVRVLQAPVAIEAGGPGPVLTRIGGRAALTGRVIDRLGTTVEGAAPRYRILTPGFVDLASADTLVALAEGTALVAVEYLRLADTIEVAVAPVPASIVLDRAADTLDLDEQRPVMVQVFDSGGARLTRKVLSLHSGDTSRVKVRAPDTLVAVLPGETDIVVRSGALQATVQVTVEGVALLADGVRSSDPAAISAARTLELTNGRVRLRWHPAVAERGGFEMDTRIGRQWSAATVRGAGDWLYVTSSVVTEPTSITLVEASPGQVAVAMRFGDHRFDPVLGKFPAHYQNEPFPFTRTLWLRPREYGYFTWVEIERTMIWKGTELEVGFGGIFGPATIRTGHAALLTDTLQKHVELNLAPVPDAAELDRYGDPLLRVLVPLPEAAMITPVFPGWGFGSIYVHRLHYESYGAYLYAAPRSAAASPRTVCMDAWAQAPFPLRGLTPTEIAGCGAS